MTAVLIGRGDEDTDKHTGRTEGGRKEKGFRRNQPCPNLDLGPGASRTADTNSHCGSHPLHWILRRRGPSAPGRQIMSRKKAWPLRNGGVERNRGGGRLLWGGSLAARSGKGWLVQVEVVGGEPQERAFKRLRSQGGLGA